MADVYLAQDGDLDRSVALKVLRPELATDERSVARIRTEARRAASITHPNLVAIHATGEKDGVPYIVMEYIEGQTLGDRLAQVGSLDEPAALEITDEVCQALAAAHRRGLIHADMKPSNILLTPEGRVKVTDFGIARAAGDDATQSSVLGTVAYVSPEHARGEKIDERSDIYSLGVVLYEMLAGRKPIEGETHAEMLVGHATREPAPLRDVAPHVSPDTERLVMRALAKDPDDRPQSAEVLRRDVRRIIAGRGLADATAEIAMPRASWQRRSKRVGMLAVTGVAIAGLLLLAGHLAGVIAVPGTMTTVPDVVGHDVEAARLVLEAHDLEVGDVMVVYGDDDDADTVAVQDPEAGSEVRRGTVVHLGVGDPPSPEPLEFDEHEDADDGAEEADEPEPGPDPDPGAETGQGNDGDDAGNGPPGGEPPGRSDDGPPGQRDR
jgi:eukaryotic-like serine/threonine-protein kinase